MCKLLRILILFAFVASLPLALRAAQVDKSIKELSRQHSILEHKLDSLKDKLENILKRITAAKNLQETDYSIFREFGLRSLLRKAQTLTKKIASLAAKRQNLSKNLDGRKTVLYIQYSRMIDNLLAQIKNDPSEKSELLSKLKAVMIARAEIAKELSPVYRSGIASIYVDSSDSPSDIYEKARILDDYETRLKKELTQIERRLKTLKNQRYALSEISHLIDEEDFFTETGFLKSVKKKESDIKVSKETELSTKTSTEGPEDPMPEDPDLLADSELQNTSGDQTGALPTAQDSATTSQGTMAANSETTTAIEHENMESEDAAGSGTEILLEGSLAKTETSLTEASRAEVEGSESSADLENADGETRRTNFQDDMDHEKESEKMSERPATISDEIASLERERSTFLKLIEEVGNKHKSLLEDASHLKMLKMK